MFWTNASKAAFTYCLCKGSPDHWELQISKVISSDPGASGHSRKSMSFIVGESGLGSWLCHPFKDLTGMKYLALSPGLLGGKMGQHLALRTGTLLPWNDKGAYGCSWHSESSKSAGLFDVFFFGVSLMYSCQLFSNHPNPQVKSASSMPHVYLTPRSL